MTKTGNDSAKEFQGQHISNILGALRLAEVVRYETEGKHARYGLKHPREIRRILDALSGFVKTTSVAPR